MLPEGTVTFLFTDVQGSTSKWESDPTRMRQALFEHNALIESESKENRGHVFKTVGDGFCVAFASAEYAANAALQIQQRLAQTESPLKIRMGLHTAAIQPTGDDYFGPPVNRAARIMAAANGGQVLLSDSTAALLPTTFPRKDLGEHLLKDLLEPSRLWQLGDGDFGTLNTLSSVRNNLPFQTTSFVGRVEELLDLRRLIDKSRLLTLTGTGGTGKSRLALQFAAENLESFPAGAWFVELAALPDRENVLREIVSSTKAPQSFGAVFDQVARFFSGERACLILDNCEHVLDVVSNLAERLVSACPHLTILATSREPLGARGEAVYRLPSLPLPEAARVHSLAQLAGYGAPALFIERLSTSAPNYGLTDDDALTIVKICKRLDGIPLALELAAARARAMRLDQIEKRLDDRFRLLTGGSRNALSRQQTLQSLIDWSVQLLTDEEKRLFTSLSVFAGGWDIEAAEEICGSPDLGIESWQVLDLLTALVDKSLVVFDHASGRYKMLESIRQYASEQLGREPWGGLLRDRHANYFLEYANPGGDFYMVLPPGHQEKFNREYENIRLALEWNSLDNERAVAAARIGCNLWAGYLFLARSGELATLLEPLIEAARPHLEEREYVWMTTVLAASHARAGRPEAMAVLERVRDRFDELDAVSRFRAATILGYGLFRSCKFQESIEVLESLVARTKVDEAVDAYPWVVLGLARACSGDLAKASEDFEIAIAIHTAKGDFRGRAACEMNLVITHALRGNWRESLIHGLLMNSISTSHGVVLAARGGVLAALGLLALENGNKEVGAILSVGGFGRDEETDPLDQLDHLFFQTVRRRLGEEVPEDILASAHAVTRTFDWEPFFHALIPVSIDDIYVEGRLVIPCPEFLPKLA